MTIQIEVEDDLQELIRQRIESGAFRDASDVVADALRSSAKPKLASKVTGRTGADLLAAMQASPHKDIDLELPRPYYPPVREVNL